MRLPILSVILLAIPAVLSQAQVHKVTGQKNAGTYIIKMKKGASRTSLISKLGGDGKIGHKYGTRTINGFSAGLDDAKLKLVRENPDVEAVYEDGIATIAGFISQTDAPWGLERISHVPKITAHSTALSYNYTRDESQGAGVDVYVLDTGINVDHVEFEGRAKWGASFSTAYPAQVDNHGHGTHCAGTVGSRAYGVAKEANIIAVKVLGDNGSGAWSDIIAGIDYVVQQKPLTGHPTIISMSIQGGVYTPVDDAVATATAAGVHFIVASGNMATNVNNDSPGRAPSAVTVGATDIDDARLIYSNYGELVDIHAPGHNVLSTYIGSTTASATFSGTSMAAPHVAGLAAYIIGLQGDMTPAALSTYLQSTAITGVVTGLLDNTPNLLAYNGAPA